jgi:hypothetical protein
MIAETFPSFRDETWLDGRQGELSQQPLYLMAKEQYH